MGVIGVGVTGVDVTGVGVAEPQALLTPPPTLLRKHQAAGSNPPGT